LIKTPAFKLERSLSTRKSLGFSVQEKIIDFSCILISRIFNSWWHSRTCVLDETSANQTTSFTGWVTIQNWIE